MEYYCQINNAAMCHELGPCSWVDPQFEAMGREVAVDSGFWIPMVWWGDGEAGAVVRMYLILVLV